MSVGTRPAGAGSLSSFPALPVLAVVLPGLLLGAAACGGGPEPVTVGGKNFTEQDVLGEILATWIERTTDLPVERRLHLGGTFVCHRALRGGDVDLYVEYTGTGLTAILGREPVQDPDSAYRAVDRAYREKWGLDWTAPLGFENTFVILVRGETADSLGLETVSDAVPHAGEWTPGFGYEFTEREDGFPGLRKTYGLEFGAQPRAMELGLTYRALAEGRIDLTAGNSTDGQIDALGLAVLRDDRSYFPPYDAVPVVRRELLERRPEVAESLERLGGRISTREMRRMNRAVDGEGRDYRDVAREWVERELAGDSAGANGAVGRDAAGVPDSADRAGDPDGADRASGADGGPDASTSADPPAGRDVRWRRTTETGASRRTEGPRPEPPREGEAP